MFKISIKLNGFTLIEILVAMAIVIALSSIALPSFADLLIKIRVDNEISSLNRLIFVARNTAINNSKNVTLCPLDDENTCNNSWNKVLSVFVDSNNNKIFEPLEGETLISVKSAIVDNDKLQYGKKRIGLTYSATGHLSGWGQNATFKYCPKGHEKFSRGIVIAVSGRIYKSSSNNNQRVDKTRSGKKIICD